jgi:hypothetical protein
MQRFVHRLARLLMALALVGLALGQTGARLHAAPLAPSPHHQAASEHAGHHEAHEHPAGGKHDHSALGCVVACCIVISNWSQPALSAECVHFASTVVYGELAQPGSGHSDAPEPGIPKHLT